MLFCSIPELWCFSHLHQLVTDTKRYHGAWAERKLGFGQAPLPPCSPAAHTGWGGRPKGMKRLRMFPVPLFSTRSEQKSGSAIPFTAFFISVEAQGTPSSCVIRSPFLVNDLVNEFNKCSTEALHPIFQSCNIFFNVDRIWLLFSLPVFSFNLSVC